MHPEDEGQILSDLAEIRAYEHTVGAASRDDEVMGLKARIAELEAQIPEPDPEPGPDPVPVGKFPLVPALALQPKSDANYNQLASDLGVDDGWFLRAYHGGSFKPIDQFEWFKWMKGKFGGLIFSTQHGTTTASYAATAKGEHDDTWAKIVASWPDGMPGGINLGNEMNLEPVEANVYRDAIEHLIEKFPLPANVFWTLAYSNFKSWTKAGRNGAPTKKGELYLPRTDKRILVLTHTYGKNQWPDPDDQQAMFHAEMDKHPTWLRGGGEASAQENPNNPDSKADFLVGAAETMEQYGGCLFTLFDSGTNGSDEIASKPHTAERIKAWANQHDTRSWT